MKSYEVQILKKIRTFNGTKFCDKMSYNFDDIQSANAFAKKLYYDFDGEIEVVLLEVTKQEILIDGL